MGQEASKTHTHIPTHTPAGGITTLHTGRGKENFNYKHQQEDGSAVIGKPF